MKNNTERKNRLLWIVVLLYVVSFILMVVNDGAFWDDWMPYNEGAEELLPKIYTQTSRAWFGYFMYFLLSVQKSFIFPRIVIFISYLIPVFAVNYVLSKIKEIEALDRFFIVAMFALFPVNSARIAVVNMVYAMSYLLFFTGLCLVVKYKEGGKLLYRLLALPVFFLSFFTNSLLVYYYATVMVYLIYSERRSFSFRRFFARYPDMLALPVVFWVYKSLFFSPYGELYEKYNRITFHGALSSLLNMREAISAASAAFFEVIEMSIGNLLPFNIFNSFLFFLVLLASAVSYKMLVKRLPFSEKGRYDGLIFIYGLVLFAAAVFPYLAVGKMPDLYDWNSRHQLLVPLGAAIIIVYGLKLFLNELRHFVRRESVIHHARLFIMVFLAVSFTVANMVFFVDYQRDWFKQVALMEKMRESDVISKNTTFLFEDHTKALDANRRAYRFYEYTSMMKCVFGNEQRFGAEMDSFKKKFGGDIENYRRYIEIPQLSIRDYIVKEPEYRVIIDHGSYSLTPLNTFKFMYWKVFDREKYFDVLDRTLALTYQKL